LFPDVKPRELYCDLHVHSNYSVDGVYSPEDILRRASERGLDVLAITDHDCCEAYLPNVELAGSLSIRLLPGVEISTAKYHLLALNFDPVDKDFTEFLRYPNLVRYPTVVEVVALVHAAGGLVGIAHPPKDIEDLSELDALAELGLDFLEIRPLDTKRDYRPFEAFAKNHGLPVSYGSDFHDDSRELLGWGVNRMSQALVQMLDRGFGKIPFE
jgi:predicted metal-dependent phosphoesterase TrpH